MCVVGASCWSCWEEGGDGDGGVLTNGGVNK